MRRVMDAELDDLARSDSSDKLQMFAVWFGMLMFTLGLLPTLRDVALLAAIDSGAVVGAAGMSWFLWAQWQKERGRPSELVRRIREETPEQRIADRIGSSANVPDVTPPEPPAQTPA